MLETIPPLAYAQPSPAQVHEHVDDQLPGAVIGHLAAAITVDDGNVAGIQYMLASARLAQGEYPRVLEQPQLVAAPGVTGIRHAAHPLPGFSVVAEPQLAHPQFAPGLRCRHSGNISAY